MNQHVDREELMAWRDGEIAGDRAAEIARHAAECATCRAAVAEFAGLSAKLAAWTVDVPGERLAAPARPAGAALAADSARRASFARPAFYWAAAAVVMMGLLATVRVECSPAPSCDLRTVHFAFMPSHAHPAAPDQVKTGVAPASPAFERDWLSRRRLPIKAAPGAKVTVVMFLDWQCPACRLAERAYGQVFADFERRMPGAVAVELKDYPLNMRCNPNVPVEMHPAACEAAVAVRLAHERGTAPAMIDWLFANQESLTPASVRTAASSIGRVPDFAARYDAVLRDVARDVAEGHGLEVSGTPTCFINGILARNDGGRTLFTPEEVRLAIETELKRKP